ncbi:HNH endonuclease [Streptomyces sp. ARC14]|uniref:HNH endonuclease n=1 Tax=Streptomyces sp. ARC14 TaxID=2724152 RepID=UPI00385718CA
MATRRRTGPTDTVRQLVLMRDGGRCVRCNSTGGLTIHHRVNRGMGSSREEWINQPQNLLLVCTTCNGWFEDHPRESYSHGWKVRRPMLPGELTVRYPSGAHYALHPDGTRTRVTAAPTTGGPR